MAELAISSPIVSPANTPATAPAQRREPPAREVESGAGDQVSLSEEALARSAESRQEVQATSDTEAAQAQRDEAAATAANNAQASRAFEEVASGPRDNNLDALA